MLDVSEHDSLLQKTKELYMTEVETFGSYVREKRLAAKINLRKLAAILDIAPAYMSDIENNHRYPPDKDKIYQIAETLQLEREETDYLFDLAARSRKNQVSPDLSDYIMGQDCVRVALRLARDKNLGPKEWETLIDLLENNSPVETNPK